MVIQYVPLFHAGIDNARNATKLEKSCFRYKKNTWHIKYDYILQPSMYLIIVVNRFRYINNNFTKDRCSIPMDMTVVLGLHIFSLHTTIDHHGPSLCSGHYTFSINCQEGGVLITAIALAHHPHPISSRSRNKRRNLWVGLCVSSWRPSFWPVYSIYYIHTIYYNSTLIN